MCDKFNHIKLEMSDESIKVAVLEQKLLDFSNVVQKLDSAIEKLSEVNSNVIKMLAVHEEKIEQCNKSDHLIIKMLDELKQENSSDVNSITKRIEDIEEQVKEVSKIKWMTVGCGIVLTVLTTAVSTMASGWWTPSEMQEHYRLQNQSRI